METQNTITSECKKIDHLTEDPVILGQEWICVSFLSPKGVKNCNLSGFKFRGAFPTQAEAEKHAKYIQQNIDPDFHVFVGEGFKWLPWDQDPDTVANQEYHEEKLNELMKDVKNNLAEKQKQALLRKKEAKTQASESNEMERANKVKDRLRKKVAKRATANKSKENNIPKELEEKVTTITESEKTIANEKQNMSDLNDSIANLQEVYAKLLKKTESK